MKFRVVVMALALVGAGACKAKAKDEKAGSGSASGTGSAPGTGSASSSASGTGSASASASGSGTGSASASGTATALGDAEVLKLFTDLEAKMCACPDVACLDAEEARVKDLEIDDSKLSDDTIGKLDAIEDSIQACGLKIAEATPLVGDHAAEGAPLLATFKAVRDAMCKCADMPCVADAGKDIEATDAKVRELFPPDDEEHLPPAFEAVMKSAQLCVEKLMPADQPVP